MFGLGKKKDPLDDLKFPSTDGSNPDPLGMQQPAAQDPLLNSGTDPLLDSGMDPGMSGSSDPNDPFGSNSFQTPPPQDAFHPSDFNSQAPDSVVPTAPQLATPDPVVAPPVAAESKLESHQMELISSKLDVLKAMLENLSQRVGSLESKIDLERENSRKGW